MNMDIRVAGETLFSRVDLDGDNSLRFAFEHEAPGGMHELVYRNGGEFLGNLRDTSDGVAIPDTPTTVSDDEDASLDIAIFLNP